MSKKRENELHHEERGNELYLENSKKKEHSEKKENDLYVEKRENELHLEES